VVTGFLGVDEYVGGGNRCAALGFALGVAEFIGYLKVTGFLRTL